MGEKSSIKSLEAVQTKRNKRDIHRVKVINRQKKTNTELWTKFLDPHKGRKDE